MLGPGGARDVLREAPGDGSQSGSGPEGVTQPAPADSEDGTLADGSPAEGLSPETRAVLDLLDGGVALFDGEQRTLFQSRTWRERLDKLTPNALLESAAQLGNRARSGETPHTLSALLDRVQSGAAPTATACWQKSRTADSVEVFELTVRPMALSDGQRALLVQAKDISARRRAERSKRETEALLGAIFETAGVGLCLCDQRGRFVSVNRGYCEIFAYRPEELIGRHYSKILPPEEREHADLLFQSFLAGQGGSALSSSGERGDPGGGPGSPRAPVEMRGRRKDGAVLYNVVSSSLLISEDGRRFVVWSVLDITDRKEHAELLAEQTVVAQRDAAEKTELLATLDKRLDVIQRQHQQILDLSAPILDLWERVLALPLIGTLDRERAATITERLLTMVVERRARFVLLDLTSVQDVDRACAECLLRIVHAVGLLGAKALLTGLTTQAATALAQLDVNLSRLPALPSLKEGLRACLDRL